MFLEALAELSPTGEGGLFALIVYQLTDAISITEDVEGEARIDATALVEGALEAMAVLGGAWAAERGVTLQVAARHLLDALRATEWAVGRPLRPVRVNEETASMDVAKPIHVTVRDARAGRDRSTDTADGAEILWEYDTDDLRYPNDGDVITSPNGETFKVLGLRSAFRNHQEILTLFATDNL